MMMCKVPGCETGWVHVILQLFSSHAWIINSCLVTGHALAAKLILQSAVDSRRLFM